MEKVGKGCSKIEDVRTKRRGQPMKVGGFNNFTQLSHGQGDRNSSSNGLS